MWGIHAIQTRALVAVLASAALPASAGTLYRCVDAGGNPAIVDARHKPDGTKCEVMANFQPSGSHRSAPAVVIDQRVIDKPETDPPAMSTPVATVPAGRKELVPAIKSAPAANGTTRRVSGQLFAYIQNGVHSYGDTTPHGQYGSLRTIRYSYIERCYACGLNPGVDFGRVPLNTTAYGIEIAGAAHEFGVDEAIVRAIIHAESAFHWNARSRVGAQGLMQLMPDTARRFGVGDAFDAAQNIRGGVQYLAWLLKRYGGDLDKAAAGYNAGEGAVDRHGGVPPYSETRLYVQRVNQLYARYRRQLASG